MKTSKGFTLVELMIIVVIIGVLAALALPRFINSTVKTKQLEAQGILKQIYSMERAYFQEFNFYTEDIDALEVEILESTRYDYSISVDGLGFTATATVPSPGLDGDDSPDTWIINETGVLQCIVNDIEE